MSSTYINSYSSSSRASANYCSKMNPTDEAIFTAGLDDVTTMLKILQELHHEDQAIIVLTKYGVRFVTAGEKSFQVSAFFAASAFQRFKFDEASCTQVNFRFLLKDFLECLNMLRDDPILDGEKIVRDDKLSGEYLKTSLYIQYRKKGEPLKLKLENKTNLLIGIDVLCFNSGNERIFCPLGFSDGDEVAVIVLNSKKLYDYVSGLDLTSSEYVELVMSRGDKPLRMATRSNVMGDVELEITSNEINIIKSEIVISDLCVFGFNYKTHFIKPALEALKTSKYTQMKLGSTGLLCIEHFHEDEKSICSESLYVDHNTDYNQPQNKRSSVEYFILSEAKSNEYDGIDIL